MHVYFMDTIKSTINQVLWKTNQDFRVHMIGCKESRLKEIIHIGVWYIINQNDEILFPFEPYNDTLHHIRYFTNNGDEYQGSNQTDKLFVWHENFFHVFVFYYNKTGVHYYLYSLFMHVKIVFTAVGKNELGI